MTPGGSSPSKKRDSGCTLLLNAGLSGSLYYAMAKYFSHKILFLVVFSVDIFFAADGCRSPLGRTGISGQIPRRTALNLIEKSMKQRAKHNLSTQFEQTRLLRRR
jgi:hypothetical protein